MTIFVGSLILIHVFIHTFSMPFVPLSIHLNLLNSLTGQQYKANILLNTNISYGV